MNTSSFAFSPEQASTIAPQVDYLFYFLTAVTAFFTLLILVLVAFLAIRYRRRRDDETAPPVIESTKLEILWTVIPLVIVMVIFFWGARLYFDMYRPPVDAIDIHVIGKQWMWKVQHPEGKREINELHVPLGIPVKLTMASQDVIHSFYIPAFRVKQDVLPGRYTQMWFTATKVGTYHLFCAEYCGTDHSGMIGRVVVMEPEKYQEWLTGSVPDEPPVESGRRLFTQLGCITCHGVQGPTLAGVFGSERQFTNGRTAIADEQYLRESILNSGEKIVAGYAPIMPSYRGQISEEQLMQLVAYIKSLQDPAAATARGANR